MAEHQAEVEARKAAEAPGANGDETSRAREQAATTDRAGGLYDAYAPALDRSNGGAGSVFVAVPAIMAELSAIAKGENAPAQMGGYAFRGIDHIVAALHPLLAKHGVTIVPQLVSIDTELSTVGSNKQQYNRIARYRFRFYGRDGSYFDAETVSEGMDTRDKGANKAATGAFKIALTQVFAIHSADSPDPDSELVDESDAGIATATTSVTPTPAPVLPKSQPPPELPKPRAWWVSFPEAQQAVLDITGFADRLGADYPPTTRAWLKAHALYAAELPKPHSPTIEAELLRELNAKAGELQALLDVSEPPAATPEGVDVAADAAPRPAEGSAETAEIDDDIPF